MAGFEHSGEISSIVCNDFSLEFARVIDRWTHTIAIAQSPGGPREMIARAVEGDDQRDDPSRIISPVFQELHFQVDSQGVQQVLAIGMQGAHHFSAVFSLAETNHEVTLAIDVADRVRGENLTMASTYSVLIPPGDLATCNEEQVAWNIPGGQLFFQANLPSRVGVAEAGRRATHVQAMTDPLHISATYRWQYSWRYLRSNCLDQS